MTRPALEELRGAPWEATLDDKAPHCHACYYATCDGAPCVVEAGIHRWEVYRPPVEAPRSQVDQGADVPDGAVAVGIFLWIAVWVILAIAIKQKVRQWTR